MPLFDAKRALVVAAHPDDEVLGCGGTVARLVGGGAEVHTLILATGALSRAGSKPSDAGLLQQAARAAAKVLGVSKVGFGELPDNAMDSVPLIDVVRFVEDAVREFQPDLVLTHHAGDLNIDHRIAHDAVLTACRPLPGCTVRTVLAYETASSTEWQSAARPVFAPAMFVNIADQLEKKLAALAQYRSEMRDSPHPRSLAQVADLARVWGRKVGMAAAEPFALIRHLAV